ncbi:MAG: hypothetical protein R3C19_21795 [Planctomycetaceae bacterium]
MSRRVFQTIAVVCLILLPATASFAQRGGGMRGGGGGGGGFGGGMRGGGPAMMGGGMQENGPGGGGMFGGNGGCSGGMGMFGSGATMNPAAITGSGFGFGDSTMTRQRMAAQQQQQNQATVDPAVAVFQRQTVQFVQGAMKYDRDHDGELSGPELKLVAAAVMAELQSRQPQDQTASQPDSRQRRGRRSTASRRSENSSAAMTAGFVAKALSYDADASGTLNAAEAQVMAAALIRSLG